MFNNMCVMSDKSSHFDNSQNSMDRALMEEDVANGDISANIEYDYWNNPADLMKKIKKTLRRSNNTNDQLGLMRTFSTSSRDEHNPIRNTLKQGFDSNHSSF